MPRVSRVLVRTAMLHLLLGFGLGAWMLASKSGLMATPALSLVGAHVDVVLAGWMMQLAMGVASWILPRDADRGPNPAPAWAAWGLLNAGVVASAWGVLLPGRLLELAAVAVFALPALPRIRSHRP